MKKIRNILITICLCLSVCSCSLGDITDIDSDSYEDFLNKFSSESSTLSEETEIEITEHTNAPQGIPSSEYKIDIEIKCIENFIFSKYNVKIYIDGLLQGTLEHGKTDTYTVALGHGTHSIKFVKEDDESIFGETQLNVLQNDTFKFEIYCTSLEISVEDLSDSAESEGNAEQTTKPQEGSSSKYEKAFVHKGTEYDLYYMFDTDEKTVIYFGTSTDLMEGIYSGDFASGVTMTWESGGDTWEEQFIYQEGNNTAAWVDYYGIEYDYEVCDVEKAQNVLNSLQSLNEEMITTSTASQEEPIGNITIYNNEDFANLMQITDATDSTTIKKFVDAHTEEVIEFDGCVALLMNHEEYTTRFDVLIAGCDYNAERVYGPFFAYENVSFYNMKVSGTDVVDEGMDFHFTAKIKKFNEAGSYIILEPIETKAR